MRAMRISLWTGIPGTVVGYAQAAPPTGTAGAKPATVDVQLDIEYIRRGTRDDVGTREEWQGGPEPGAEGDIWGEYPILRAVPVHFPGTANMSIRGAVDVGETGWVKFSQRSLDYWTARGAGNPPPFLHFLEIADAVFEPGLRHGAAIPPPVVEEGKTQIGPEDGSAGLEVEHGEYAVPKTVSVFNPTARIDIGIDGSITLTGPAASVTMDAAGVVTVQGTQIKLGPAAVSNIIKGPEFQTWASTHIHTAPPGGGPTSPPTVPIPPNTLSSKVFTE